MKKTLLTCIIFFLLSGQILLHGQSKETASTVDGQKLSVASGRSWQFESTQYGFGKILDTKGPVSHRFMFTNSGVKDIKLTKVIPTCGCTTSDWTKDPVKPGTTGYVDVTFNPKNRAGGAFAKTIIVLADQYPDTTVLTITGNIYRIKTINDSFNYQVGNFSFMTNTVGFGQLSDKISDTTTDIAIRNYGDTAIVISAFNDMGNNFIFVNNLPQTVAPHSKILLPIHFAANKIKNNGVFSGRVSFITTDSQIPEKKIFIYANVLNDPLLKY